MTIVEEIVGQMRHGTNSMFVVGLAKLSIQKPQEVFDALKKALAEYNMSDPHELGPIAKSYAQIERGK